jgi:uncharacterized protein (TIGR02996 family)
MSTARDALLAAACADPDDDTPRLAYADYLDERGEAEYATFVRRQVELARLPEWDEGRLRAEYLDRSAVNGDQWYGTKCYNIALPEGIRWEGGPFRRGFPAALSVRSIPNFVAHAAEIFRAAPVEELEVWGDSSTREPLDVQPLAECPWLGRIRRLELPLANLDRRGLDLLLASPHTTRLADLSLETSLGPDTSPAALFRSPLVGRLERLAVHVMEPHTDDTLAAILKSSGAHRLRHLRLTSGRYNGRPVFSTSGSSTPPRCSRT